MSSDVSKPVAGHENAPLLASKRLESKRSNLWFRQTWVVTMVLAFTASALLVASRAPTRLRGPPVETFEKFHERVLKTVTEYGENADIHTLQWTPAAGFSHDPYDHAEDLALKVGVAAELIEKTIRMYFPERLSTDKPPFEIVFIITDFPQTYCVDKSRHEVDGGCDVHNWAPIYSFSSVPRDKDVLPTLVGSTLITFAQDVEAQLGAPAANNMPGGWAHVVTFNIEDVPVESRGDYEFDNLINKIVWRGTDYPFLGPAYGTDHHRESTCHSILGRGWTSDHCQLLDMTMYGTDQEAFRTMLSRNEITPRTRAVLMSRVEGGDSWIDARFANTYLLTHPYAVQTSQRSILAERFKLDASMPMTPAELARFKYQIDLGGWGGTTWTGTILKLSMPGCLLHHETYMEDSYFDDLVAYEHYIPVKEDLSDLHERFEELEADPELCRRISANANEWVQKFNSRHGLLHHNYEKLAKPLTAVIDPDRQFFKPFHVVHPEFFLSEVGSTHLRDERRLRRRRQRAAANAADQDVYEED